MKITGQGIASVCVTDAWLGCLVNLGNLFGCQVTAGSVPLLDKIDAEISIVWLGSVLIFSNVIIRVKHKTRRTYIGY